MKSTLATWMLMLALGLAACRPSATATPASANPSQGALRVLVDADTANEVDDLLAIARALREPRFFVVALTGAQYVTQEGAPADSAQHSHRLNQRLLAALGRQGLPTAAGSDIPMPDARTPRDSEAARLIIEHARATPEGRRLYVVTLGAVTNLASAILLAPDIVPRISAFAIMLRYEPSKKDSSLPHQWIRDEFNANNDQHAVDALFAAEALELTVMTATASRPLVFTRATVDQYLADRPGFGRFLLEYWDSYVQHMTWKNKLWDEARAWVMWDVALVEALADPALARKQSVAAPPALDGTGGGRSVQLFTQIDAPAMEAAYWRRVAGPAQH